MESMNEKSIESKINTLSKEKMRYLKQMLNAKNSGMKTHGDRIEKRANSDNKLACSPIQTEFWYRWKLLPDYQVDNIAGYVKLQGELERSSIEKAFSEMIKHHEVLRSKFIYQAESIFVEIADENDGDIKFYDFTELSGNAAGEDIFEVMRKESLIRFDLAEGRLIRLRCYKTAADEWYLLMVQHHIISDGTSTNILIKEMLNSMERLQGKKADLNPQLRIQYYDYVTYLNNKLQKGEFDTQKAYWKEELKDCDMDLRLCESPYKKEGTLFEGGRVCFRIDKEISNKVEAVSRKYTTTPFAFYMSAFRTLLYRYTRQNDVVIVIPVQGRNNQEVQNLIGCFLNMVSIRNSLTDGDSFIDCVKRENNKVINALENQDIPFGTVLKELNLHSESMASSVYHIVFSYEGNVMRNVSFGDFKVEFDELFLNTTKSDLVLELSQEDDGLSGWFEYSAGKFSEKQITLFKDAFLEMLKNATADENQSISEVDFMNDAERKQVIGYGTGSKGNWELKTINRMFSEMAAIQPEKEALLDEHSEMTYGELDKISNRAARYLRAAGACGGTITGVMMGKSKEFFVAVMSILKAGGAYLPIEPTYPQERIHYMMEDSGAGFLIYDEEYNGNFSFLTDVKTLKFSAFDLNQFSDEPLPEYNSLDTLAYIIYTSGTTGKPKGVMVGHRGVSNLAYFFHEAYGIGPQDRILQFSHIVFDACVWEMAISILIGGGLCIVRKETLLDVTEFVKQVHHFGITVTYFSPQYWKQILKEDLKFRVLLTAGSEADENVVRSAASSDIYVNGYGPTENTVCISLWSRRQGEEFPKKIPIGKPMSNAQVYILEKGKLCGVGVIGEICVAGDGLAHGYLNRPELTAKCFTANPFGQGKLYHTGDFGLWREDGQLEYVGRIDGQLKIRGYRVETGEIETCLCKHENIDTAVISVFEDANGEKMLAAYMVLNAPLTVKMLDEYLRKILPFYMIPTKYYHVESIPLTNNDKTDFKALEKIGIPVDSGYEYVEPSTDTERKLAAIWEESLNVSKISANDSFFECGGDSIIIIQIINRAAQEGIHIELKSFYEDKTIANIAKNAIITSDADGESAADAWNREFERYNKSAEAEFNRRKWFEEDCSDLKIFPVDFQAKAGTQTQEKLLSRELPAEYEKAFAEEKFGNFNITAYDLLLSAFALTLHQWSKEGGAIFLDNTRRDLQLNGITGGFSFDYPFIFHKEFFKEDNGEFMKAVKNKLFEINKRKYDYTVCRKDERLPEILKDAEVRLRYRTTEETFNDSGKTENIRLDICNDNGKISFQWFYDGQLYKEQTISGLSESMIRETEELVDYCLGTNDMGITASDFDNSDINQDDLDYLLSKFN